MDENLALPEWEAFAGFVALVAEGVGTTVDARVEALRQQHDTNIQAYKARIDHLKSMLIYLRIYKSLELLPTTGKVSTSQSIQNYQYTADMFTENHGLH